MRQVDPTRLQPGAGNQVVVDITRGGRDAAKLKVATGEVHGFQSLRVVYGADQIVYHDMGYRSRTLAEGLGTTAAWLRESGQIP